MKTRILIQILLSILILIIIFTVYQKYFKKGQEKKEIIKKEKIISEENNLINITYESVDKQGRKYVISAETGTLRDEEPDLIYMSNVSAKIILKDGEIIYIDSLNAQYNTLNYDTKFQKNVKLTYIENKIFCENLNIFFKDNLIEAFNELTYKNLDIIMMADKIEIDLYTKNSKIFNTSSDKVLIKKRNLNGNN